jgi:hypothetical protein
MNDMTNEKFRFLMSLEKIFMDSSVTLPLSGGKESFNLQSTTTNDKFILDIDRRSKFEFSKLKLQNRYAITKLPLVRIDINTPPHINPDGEKLSRNHIHVFRETQNDTGNLPWAFDLDTFDGILFDSKEPFNFMQIFTSFCDYCNINCNGIKDVK